MCPKLPLLEALLTRISAEWNKDGFSFDTAVATIHDRNANEEHCFPENCRMMLIEGDVEIHYHDGVRKLLPGEEVVIPKNTPHCVRIASGVQARWAFGFRSG